ncbi:MAG: hypothetical protein N2645_06845 [Clostridia bacterium]|nr:hypothetical protein [Clostridia bacterium]
MNFLDRLENDLAYIDYRVDAFFQSLIDYITMFNDKYPHVVIISVLLAPVFLTVVALFYCFLDDRLREMRQK